MAIVLGRLPVAMWGYPLWSFAPLAALMWLPPAEPARQRRFAAGFLAIFIAMPLAYVIVEGLRTAGARPAQGDAISRPGAGAEGHAGVARKILLTRSPMWAAASSPPTTSRSIRPTVRT